MDANNLKIYLKRLISDGHRWQYTDLIEEGTSPLLFFSKTQWVFLIISVSGAIFLKKGLSTEFVGYVISALSIFVGLFLTLIIAIFDKFINLPKIDKPNEDELAYLYKRRNFFKQFTSLTSYAIVISLMCIVLLGLMLLASDFFDESILNYTFCAQLEDIMYGYPLNLFHLLCVTIYISVLIYFLLDFLLLVVYAVVSVHSYMMIEYKKQQ